MIALKRLSDGLFVLAVVLLVVAIVTSTPLLYGVAAFAFVDSIAVTVMKRRRAKAAKP